jgi:cytoskeletal protein CcmA (bactofilin family)
MSTLRHLRIVLGVVIAATLAMGAPAAALAAEIRSGDTVAVGAAETINDDVYAFGNNIVIDGTVNGDVIAAGSTVTINGHVTGDVMMAGNTLIINAPVDGSVRAAGNLVNVTAPIAGDAVVAGSAISVNGPGKIGRDVLAASGALTLRGPVGRNVKAGAGTLTLASNVGGSVQAEVSDLVVASGAAVQGPISYVSGKEASIAPDAQFGGSVQRSAPPTRTPNPWVIGGIDVLALIRGFVGLAVFGLVFALVFPRATTATADVVQRRGLASFGLGFGLFVGIPVLALLVCIFGAMVGGWWIGLIVFAAYIVFAVLGYLAFAEWAGATAAQYASWHLHPAWSLLIGVAIVGLLTLIPFIGPFVGFVAVLMGMGAVALTGWYAYHGAPATSAPTVGAPAPTAVPVPA